MSKTKAFVRKLADVAPVPCPCGQSQRIVTNADNDRVSVHRVRINGEAKAHYHKALSEYYVILEGEGAIELDGRLHAVAPGDVVYIPPLTRHALRGRFEIINVVSPPFDPTDEHLVE